jgi:hypothetical protein
MINNLEPNYVENLKARPIKLGVEAQKKHGEMVDLVARAKKLI